MPGNITFSSNVLVDDQSTPEARFQPITLNKVNRQVFNQLSDESQLSYALTFIQEGVRAAHSSLAPLEAVRVLDGQPRATLDAYYAAAAFGGELVTLEYCLYNQDKAETKETVTRTGIITRLRYSGGPGGPKVQRLEFVFYVCHKLWVRQGGVVTSYTQPEAA